MFFFFFGFFSISVFFFFFFNDTATTEIYTLSLHDALPIWPRTYWTGRSCSCDRYRVEQDRKSTRLNSSHLGISYAVFCLKKKNKNVQETKNIKKQTNHRHNESVSAEK